MNIKHAFIFAILGQVGEMIYVYKKTYCCYERRQERGSERLLERGNYV